MSRSLRFMVGACVLLAVAAGCSRTSAPNDVKPSPSTTAGPSSSERRTDPDIALTGTRWVVHSVAPADTSATLLPPPGIEAYLVFDGTGGFTGSTGCAAIGGTAVITDDRITVTVSGAATCTDDGLTLHNAMLSALRGEVGYRVDWLTLTLSGSDGTELILRAAG